MADCKSINRVWDIIEKVGVGMLTTQFRGGLRARPLEARPDRKTGAIFFVTDVRGLKDNEIEASPDVGFVMIAVKDKAYLSITGHASIALDRERLRKIWKRTDDMWWPDGPDDPNARLLRLDPATAELWDGPSSSAVAAYEMAKALATGKKPNLGERRKKTVAMRPRRKPRALQTRAHSG